MQQALAAYPVPRAPVPRLIVVFPIAILIGVITGALLGTVFGPVRAISDPITTAYGNTVSVAFALVVIAVVGRAGRTATEAIQQGGARRSLPRGRIHLHDVAAGGGLTTLQYLGKPWKSGLLEWAVMGSNQRPPRCKRGALAN